MTDYIKREDAIKACDEKAWMHGEDIIGVRYPTSDEIRATIETLPSADVVEREHYNNRLKVMYSLGYDDARAERKSGEWIEECEGKSVRYRCSVCNDDDGWRNYNYCANCGADMRGAE